MLLVRSELEDAGLKADLLLQVHDELVLECDEADAPAVAQAVRTAMLRAGQGIPTDGRGLRVDLKAPLQVDVRWGHSWADAH
jgi:DNA polymerase-1